MDLCTAFSFAASSPAASAAALATFNAAPAAGTTWQILLDGPLAIDPQAPAVTPDVEVLDVDLFANQASTFAALGKRVVCYFSAGSYEDGRTDSGDFDAGEGGDLGRELEGWPGEYWLDTNSETTNRNGLGLTAADSIDCISFLAFEARRRGLAMGLKNGGSIIKNVLPVIDFSVNEECAAYSECDLYKAVTDASKPCSTSSTRTWRKRGCKTRMRGDGPARRRARAGSAPS
ncbi:hypothetical protein VDGE_30082 [Verticillium dahliae]|uniref:alpha-galactosidase n=1 Tax=Verticillium dahliae TaxID=27337 RepID=A0A444RW00_VERDA|nr:hypothetical protein VDGE_30082 [Verticillium dahliae]